MKSIVQSLVTFGIIGLFVAQIGAGLAQIDEAISGPMQFPNRSIDDKMRVEWGSYYDLMRFVQDKTPEDAILLLGTKSPFATLDLYFLYPRKLLFGSEETLNNHPEIGYVVISDGYPTFPVPGEKMMLDDKQGIYRLPR